MTKEEWKLIGARYFHQGYAAAVGSLNSSFHTPRDTEGHGSHTLSTAGGNFVEGASVFGFGNGTAKGGSPKARVAAYKVCWPPVGGNECFDADILAAFDIAIHDGHGIVVVCSAGNSGPADGTVSNISPWQFTVGASTMDRQFPSYVVLGNKKRLEVSFPPDLKIGLKESLVVANIEGQSAWQYFDMEEVFHLKPCHPTSSFHLSVLQMPKQLMHQLMTRKDRTTQAIGEGKDLGVPSRGECKGGQGPASCSGWCCGDGSCHNELTGNEVIADPHVLPASHINFTDGVAVFTYLNSTKSPIAYITPSTTELGTKPAPFMAAFSSKGPNTITPEILKPDITAPGGTSMSCPHVSGIVGLLKTLHPDWSPAAIRSAMMTTARTMDNSMEAILNASYFKATPFSYGAGHVRPNRAMNPGLVYDLNVNDYLNFLCALVPKLHGSITVTRTLKNVGLPETYKARIRKPTGISVSVKPDSLKFIRSGEKTFSLTLQAERAGAARDYVFGELIWSDAKHFVRSPIVVKAA
ncbi:Subtilisin-like protease SBT5.3 [Vitis vinifera]|uniref:Subtilisin-like protease SBT5.3 n=1 Tax=Vitis vinifera TaxID=29760 RepID=A0A438JHA9_VITVI|nr:Subtilisin-like protease SBT5.3 [Vitis vinifera]